MNKARAIELLGGTVTAAAAACGISSSAVSQWRDEGDLPKDIEDRVLAALARKHLPPELIGAKGALAQEEPAPNHSEIPKSSADGDIMPLVNELSALGRECASTPEGDAALRQAAAAREGSTA